MAKRILRRRAKAAIKPPFWTQRKKGIAKRAGTAALALPLFLGGARAASALEARADSAQAGAGKAKSTFVAGAAGWRAPLGKQ